MAFEFFTPGLCQIVANAGGEFVLFDTEHSGVGIETIKSQVAYARGTGIAPLVRVPGSHYHLVAPMLDAGVMGIMVPMVETAEQAASIASWCRYRPDGVRGLAFGMPHDDYLGGDHIKAMKAANERTLVIALIETAAGIENVEAIMATPGIDIGWIGHFDLTNALGIDGQFDHPRYKAAVKALVARLRAQQQGRRLPVRRREDRPALSRLGLSRPRLRHRHRRIPRRAQGRHRRAARAKRLIAASDNPRVIRSGAIPD